MRKKLLRFSNFELILRNDQEILSFVLERHKSNDYMVIIPFITYWSFYGPLSADELDTGTQVI